MDKAGVSKTYKLGDPSNTDVIVQLRNREGRRENFHCHSFILIKKSKFFADRLSHPNTNNFIELPCLELDYEYAAKLLRMFYVSEDSLFDPLDSVRIALGVLQVAVSLHCEEISKICVQYLEAVPWEDEEEGEILKIVRRLGSLAEPILARIQPVDLEARKNVFLSAIRFLMSTSRTSPLLVDLKTSAWEQIEYILLEDEDGPLVTVDNAIKAEVKLGVLDMFTVFEKEFSSLLQESNPLSEEVENKIMQSVLDLEWMNTFLTKMNLSLDFVSRWIQISDHLLGIIQDEKLDSVLWGLKGKLIEVTGKVLEAIGYGKVSLPVPVRIQFLKTWLPYIRKMKPLLDSEGNEELGFPYKMADDSCENIEKAMISIVLGLPVNDQADILSDWIQTNQENFPDLSEALEVWCYRTKSSKRRLMVGFDEVGNATVTL